MEFDNKHKVEKWWNLTAPQSKTYLKFLDIELQRHKDTIQRCKMYKGLAGHFDVDKKAWKELWDSEILRQKEDVEQIDILIGQVKNWFKL